MQFSNYSCMLDYFCNNLHMSSICIHQVTLLTWDHIVGFINHAYHFKTFRLWMLIAQWIMKFLLHECCIFIVDSLSFWTRAHLPNLDTILMLFYHKWYIKATTWKYLIACTILETQLWFEIWNMNICKPWLDTIKKKMLHGALLIHLCSTTTLDV